MKEIHFISGLPRSGSTLLCNILNQNPEFHATSTSGIREIIEIVKNNWENEHFKASPNMEGKENVLRGIIHNYYSNVDKPIIFDKNRGWPGSLELANHLVNGKAKIILTVRDITDILSSLEKIYRKSSHNLMLPQEKANQIQFRTVAGRCENWVSSTGMVGQCYVEIVEAFKRGLSDQLLIVEFDDLTLKPKETLDRIYKFLGKESFEHNFDKVEQSTKENDSIRGFPNDLHTIRPQVEFKKSDAINILGKELFNKYSNAEFWRQK